MVISLSPWCMYMYGKCHTFVAVCMVTSEKLSTAFYCTSKLTLIYGEALQLHTVYKKLYFLLQVTRESVSVLQVMQESVSGTTSHMRASACMRNEIKGSYDKIIITIVPSYTGKKYHSFVAVGIVTRASDS